MQLSGRRERAPAPSPGCRVFLSPVNHKGLYQGWSLEACNTSAVMVVKAGCDCSRLIPFTFTMALDCRISEIHLRHLRKLTRDKHLAEQRTELQTCRPGQPKLWPPSSNTGAKDATKRFSERKSERPSRRSEGGFTRQCPHSRERHSKRSKRQGTVTSRENIDTEVCSQVEKKPKGDNLKAAKAQPVGAASRTSIAGLFNCILSFVFYSVIFKKKHTLHWTHDPCCYLCVCACVCVWGGVRVFVCVCVCACVLVQMFVCWYAHLYGYLSPRAHSHVVGMLQFMSDINQPSLPTSFYSVLVSSSVLWPFQLYFIPSIFTPTLPFLTLFFQSYLGLIGPFNFISLYESLLQPWYNP